MKIPYNSNYLILLEYPLKIHCKREKVKMVKKLENILIEFIDYLPELFILADALDWTVVLLNESMAESLGKTKAEILGKNILDFFPPNVKKIRKKQAEKVILTGKPAFFIDERDGRWFENAFYPIFDSRKKVIFGACIIREITQQKKAEKALIESEEKFKNLAEQSPNMIYINRMGKIVYANKICEKIMGYSRKELYSSDFNFLNLIAPEYKDMINTSFKKHMDGKEVPPFEYTLITKKGKGIEAIHSTKLIKYEGKPAILGIITDITKHKKIEKDVRQMKDHLQNIIDSTDEMVFVLDKNLNISTWNKTAELITGYKRKEVIGKSLGSLDLFDDLDSIFLCFKNVTENRAPLSIEFILRTKFGAKRLIRVSCSSLKSENEEIRGILFIGRDITQEDKIHGNLISGNSYLISEKTNDSVVHLFKDLTMSNYDGLFITRGNLEDIKNIIHPLENVEAIILSQEKIIGFEHVRDLGELATKIENFTEKNPKSLILLDRIDYLITNFSFNEVIKVLYKITETISRNLGIFLVRLNPSVINESQLAVIEEELNPLPSKKIDAIELEDYLYDILTFIDGQNQHNILVSFKKIGQKFSISKVTTAKRLNILKEKDLIFIKKHGKLKTIHISDRGKMLLHRRKII